LPSSSIGSKEAPPPRTLLIASNRKATEYGHSSPPHHPPPCSLLVGHPLLPDLDEALQGEGVPGMPRSLSTRRTDMRHRRIRRGKRIRIEAGVDSLLLFFVCRLGNCWSRYSTAPSHFFCLRREIRSLLKIA
jgi:hypothetical protein